MKMWLATAEEMRGLDQAAIQDYGIPGMVLMENAGLAVVQKIKEHFSGDLTKRRVLILVGKGNNGGDGLVVARHLFNLGAEPKLFLLCKPEELQGDAAANWQIVSKMAVPCQLILSERDLNLIRVGLIYSELVVDSIFGTGFHGAVQGLTARLIEMVNEAKKPVIAVDLPSGMEANSGAVKGVCIRADETVTFGLAKIGLVLEPAAGFVGRLTVADISLPADLIRKQRFKRFLLESQWCREKIPRRPAESHKGSFGHVLVIGGAPGMSGAPLLAAAAAVRSGAGLVTAAVPRGINNIIEVKITEAMSRPLPETDQGTISLSSLNVLQELARGKVAVLGPGLSRQKETGDLVRAFIANMPCPAVVDADALFALAGCREILLKSKFPLVLTPHPGEMASLLGISTADVQSNRIEVALRAAAEWKVTVVLKGTKTLVATPAGMLYINPSGNPGMATGGAGDVLSGVIGSFMAQGMKPEEAAAAGVYFHGLAGDAAARQKGWMGLAAGDLVEFLPEILKDAEVR